MFAVIDVALMILDSNHMDKHVRPYRCSQPSCAKLQGFTYSGGLIQHEKEVHGKHGALKMHRLCPYEGCTRSSKGMGFTRKANLNEHIRRVHQVGAQQQEAHQTSSLRTSSFAEVQSLASPHEKYAPDRMSEADSSKTAATRAVEEKVLWNDEFGSRTPLLEDTTFIASSANSPAQYSELQEDAGFDEYPLAPTTTDEGYQSMNKQEQMDADEEDAQSDADSVRTDNRDSGLPSNVKERLSSHFAQELLDNLQLPKHQLVESIDRICSSMPDLLREYSTFVGSNARSDLQERACIFVRHQRK